MPFAQQNLVGEAHQRPLHVILELDNELYAVHEEVLEDPLADISLVAYQFPIYLSQEVFVSRGVLSLVSPGVMQKFEYFSCRR